MHVYKYSTVRFVHETLESVLCKHWHSGDTHGLLNDIYFKEI